MAETFMNKFVYQPLPVLLRAEPGDARWTSNSTKILRAVATLGTVFALCGAVAICLIGFGGFSPRTLETKAPVDVPILPATKVSPTAAPDHDNGMATLPMDSKEAYRGTIAEDHSVIDQMPAAALKPTSTPASVPQPEATVSDNELLKGRPEVGRINLGKQLPEAVRKNLEKDRREAERKRFRLEEMYRKNAISGEAYKTGEEKYRSEIERYRREMNARMAGQN